LPDVDRSALAAGQLIRHREVGPKETASSPEGPGFNFVLGTVIGVPRSNKLIRHQKPRFCDALPRVINCFRVRPRCLDQTVRDWVTRFGGMEEGVLLNMAADALPHLLKRNDVRFTFENGHQFTSTHPNARLHASEHRRRGAWHHGRPRKISGSGGSYGAISSAAAIPQ
jgi:hypothetical protein